MALTVGSRLGHYDVTALIGEGGMGQVYQATDTKLGRQVALKILPEAFAADPDRLARFQREAQVLASLNHPGIAAIYGIEDSEGTKALVLELVEGPTLADRIAQGSIPVDEALPIAKQIVEALEAAHEAGVIHRDLKPANIKLREDGTVKVLDFGLAKALHAEASGDPSESPTLTAAATAAGALMGTAAYMSPEQAKGAQVDRRTDVWAFGCVLYEMLSGRRAFPGQSVSETLAAVIAGSADYSALPTDVPPAVRKLVRRCLQRDVSRRLRDVADGWLDVSEAADAPSDHLVGAAGGSVGGPNWRWSVAAVVLTSALAAFVFWTGQSTPEPARRDVLSVTPPSDVSLPTYERIVASLSPDGDDLVVVGDRGGQRQLYHRPLDSADATPLPGTEGAAAPFFSPDGEWVGFFSGNNIRRVRLGGGVPETVCELPIFPNTRFAEDLAIWTEGDLIWFGAQSTGLYRVSARGGTPEQMSEPDSTAGERGHFWPQPLPNRASILYTIRRGNNNDKSVAVFDPETGEHRILLDGQRASYSPSGHLVFMDNESGSLLAVPFDIDSQTVGGSPVLVRDDARRLSGGIISQAYLGPDGTLVYVPRSEAHAGRSLVWVDRSGAEHPLPAEPRDYMELRLSPDGQYVAATALTGGNQDIWVLDVSRPAATRLTSEEWEDRTPAWTPDGQRLIFSTGREDMLNAPWSTVAFKSADGTGGVERVMTDAERASFPISWAADGRTIVMAELSGSTGWDISSLDTETGRVTPLIREPSDEGNPEVSPNGRWLAYSSNESGRHEVYVRSFPDIDGFRVQVSVEGGQQPAWSHDGRELFFRDGTSCEALNLQGCQKDFLVVQIQETASTLEIGVPEVLFSDPYHTALGRLYDVSRDGERFLMIKDTADPRQINIVRSWDQELRERVPSTLP